MLGICVWKRSARRRRTRRTATATRSASADRRTALSDQSHARIRIPFRTPRQAKTYPTELDFRLFMAGKLKFLRCASSSVRNRQHMCYATAGRVCLCVCGGTLRALRLAFVCLFAPSAQLAQVPKTPSIKIDRTGTGLRKSIHWIVSQSQQIYTKYQSSSQTGARGVKQPQFKLI